jgi:murein DD-endopeptidase MepM/ murein hydrolase activator NlpD
MLLLVAALLLTATFAVDDGCVRLRPPVTAPVVRPYAPVGSYGGHWGVDFAVPVGTTVRAAESGTVTFAGSVAGRLSVTVEHGGGLRTSYSYLAVLGARSGQMVSVGDPVGTSGLAHGEPALHFSVRVEDRYQDPAPWLICSLAPAPGLRLAAVYGRSVYPRRGATWNPRWNLRPSSCRSPVRR